MKKGILALTVCLFFFSPNVFAADGDLIVNGKVGIGTTSPGVSLDINGKINVFDGGTKSYNGGISSEVGGQIVNFGINDDLNNRFGGSYSSAVQGGLFRLDTRNASGANLFQWFGRAAGSTAGLQQLMVISATGNVGIGTTDPAGYKLYVNGPVIASDFYYYSDISLKKNISSIGNAMGLIQGLQGVRFDWNEEEENLKNYNKGRQIGLIAQDVERVIPEIVNTDEKGFKAVAYDKLTVVLIEALKEQQNEINQLKNEIEYLKRR